MPRERTPIGRMHVRDFAPARTQRPLSDLTADGLGYVRFDCGGCPRTGKVRLEALKARFAPDTGLVNVLNSILPQDCPLRDPDPSGSRLCRFRYRDL